MPDPITGMPLASEITSDYARNQNDFLQKLLANKVAIQQHQSNLATEALAREVSTQQQLATAEEIRKAKMANDLQAQLIAGARVGSIGQTPSANALGIPVNAETVGLDVLRGQKGGDAALADMTRVAGGLAPTANAVLQAGTQKAVAGIQAAAQRYATDRDYDKALKLGELEAGIANANNATRYQIFSEGVLLTAAQEYGEFTPEMRDAFQKGGIKEMLAVANKTPATRLRALAAIGQAKSAAYYGYAQVLQAKSPQMAIQMQALGAFLDREAAIDRALADAVDKDVPPQERRKLIETRAQTGEIIKYLYESTFGRTVPTVIDPTNEKETGDYFSSVVVEKGNGPALSDDFIPDEVRETPEGGVEVVPRGTLPAEPTPEAATPSVAVDAADATEPVDTGLVESVTATAPDPGAPPPAPVARNTRDLAKNAALFDEDGNPTGLDENALVDTSVLSDTRNAPLDVANAAKNAEWFTRNAQHAKEWEGFAGRIGAVLTQFPNIPQPPAVDWINDPGEAAARTAEWWTRVPADQQDAILAKARGE